VGINSPEAREHAPAVRQAEEDLRRTLTPSKPDWEFSFNRDLYDTDLPPEVERILSKVWEAIVRDYRLPPPFPPEQRREWVVLLGDAVRVLEEYLSPAPSSNPDGGPEGGGPRKTDAPPGPFADLRAFARDRLKFAAQRIVELVCDGDGECPLADLAADLRIGWEPPYDNAFNKAARRINEKLRLAGLPYWLHRSGNAAKVEEGEWSPRPRGPKRRGRGRRK
jgi:hypothetical protein